MKANTFKYVFFAIVIILIGLAGYLLYKDGKQETININSNELKINMIGEINIGIVNYDNINPLLSNNRDIQYIDKLIFDSLLDITVDFKIENSLASEFSKINSTTYLIKLRDDIYWHDGTKFTAQDVVFTITNLKKENINSIYKENVENINQIDKIDDYTIRLTLNQEIPFFEYMMTFPIVASHAYDAETLSAKTVVPIGTGKYKILKIEENKIEIGKTNTEEEGKISKINIIIEENSKNLYTALSNKEIDLMVTDNINYEDYIGTMGYNDSSACGREFDYLVLNTQDDLLNSKEIRQAINFAIDKNSINYFMYKNKYNISKSPLGYRKLFGWLGQKFRIRY